MEKTNELKLNFKNVKSFFKYNYSCDQKISFIITELITRQKIMNQDKGENFSSKLHDYKQGNLMPVLQVTGM